jgi:hypothetical protein
LTRYSLARSAIRRQAPSPALDAMAASRSS